jgi:NADH dehydrogenase
MMADIGKRSGVAIIFGIKIHGFIAWWLWRTYYLANVPNVSKRLEVMIDWTIHLLFKRDVAIVKRAPRDTSRELENGQHAIEP